jgi:hypothetical protein
VPQSSIDKPMMQSQDLPLDGSVVASKLQDFLFTSPILSNQMSLATCGYLNLIN